MMNNWPISKLDLVCLFVSCDLNKMSYQDLQHISNVWRIGETRKAFIRSECIANRANVCQLFAICCKFLDSEHYHINRRLQLTNLKPAFWYKWIFVFCFTFKLSTIRDCVYFFSVMIDQVRPQFYCVSKMLMKWTNIILNPKGA